MTDDFIPRYDDMKHFSNGKCLLCNLKSVSDNWHLVFSDGYTIDTRHQSTGKDKFTKASMYKYLKG